MSHARLVVGCMSGTSIDGVDVALVETRGSGVSMSPRFLAFASVPFPTSLAARLRAIADQHPLTAGDITRTSAELCLVHDQAIRLLNPSRVDLICAHGQTVFHHPPLSWQMFSPAPLAHAWNCPVVFDLRAADLAAGGQGAPLTPLADWILLREALASRQPNGPGVIVNLGGFLNATILPHAHNNVSSIRGLDVCPCNHLLDAIARDRLGLPYDADGRLALQGQPHAHAADELLRSFASGRSLGTGDEARSWITRWTALTPQDALATACSAIADALAKRLADQLAGEHERGAPAYVALAGGGSFNQSLSRAIERALTRDLSTSTTVVSLASLGLPPQAREAACFAVLGALCQDGVGISLPHITGCAPTATGLGPRAGSWFYP
ncbi:MAG: anhydro-N-acetylmuramic acid kinase [Planctomycetota bacterium]|nr:anhydro-N-acetylmuramic acid kinase [Planctomycetota bacterium]